MPARSKVSNDAVAAIFEEMADLLEIEDANPFRVRAYRNAARTVHGLGRELAELAAEGRDLTSLPFIGRDLAAKIEEILRSGSAAALDKLHQRVPASLEALLRLPGLGPKRVQTLYRRLGIENLDQLEKAARAGRLQTLPGFGPRTSQRIVEAIAAARAPRRFLRVDVEAVARDFVDALRAVPGVRQVVAAGSFRRGAETVGDLDILATASDSGKLMRRFVELEPVETVVSRGATRATVLLANGLQVDLRAVEPASYGAALHYFTGSKAHNIAVRRLAQGRGLKLNEYGVFRGERRVAGRSEASVFRAVGLPFIEPELRENRGEIEAAHAGELPRLIERGDLVGDLHVHTDATDGRAGLEEMARAARRAGLRYIAITDHSKRLSVANGLDASRLDRQIDEIERLNARLRGIHILKGIEVEILSDGSLDLPDRVLRKLDLVIGAVHSGFGLPRDKQTARILRAMDRPCFTMLAHPSGRLLGERDAYEVDLDRVIEHARARGCFVELNSQPRRLDLSDTFCRLARDEGVPVCINSDAHSTADFANLGFGVAQARRGWVEKSDVVNTRALSPLRKLLATTMA